MNTPSVSLQYSSTLPLFIHHDDDDGCVHKFSWVLHDPWTFISKFLVFDVSQSFQGWSKWLWSSSYSSSCVPRVPRGSSLVYVAHMFLESSHRMKNHCTCALSFQHSSHGDLNQSSHGYLNHSNLIMLMHCPSILIVCVVLNFFVKTLAKGCFSLWSSNKVSLSCSFHGFSIPLLSVIGLWMPFIGIPFIVILSESLPFDSFHCESFHCNSNRILSSWIPFIVILFESLHCDSFHCNMM